ncbi:hypothetical protein ACQZ5N_18665 [Agrobacterium sp. 22-221-1]|uniref:hypothetical protein n=1 Tax=Agrobacterium leguminum TaxID=2792015 RepID=UPI003CE47E3D
MKRTTFPGRGRLPLRSLSISTYFYALMVLPVLFLCLVGGQQSLRHYHEYTALRDMAVLQQLAIAVADLSAALAEEAFMPLAGRAAARTQTDTVFSGLFGLEAQYRDKGGDHARIAPLVLQLREGRLRIAEARQQEDRGIAYPGGPVALYQPLGAVALALVRQS